VVLADLRNGNITNYTVLFRTEDNTSNGSKTVRERATTLLASDGVMAGVTYIITVLASTGVGPGPQSSPAMQGTIMEPADIATGPGADSFTAVTNDVTQTTIPITLPPISAASFSHFWVIAMKVDDSFAASIREDGTVRFPNGSPISNNSSFVVYPDDIRDNTPYIVAEVDATNSILSTPNFEFILGDQAATRDLNDRPDLYRNRPLTEGTQYTVFLWGFPPSVVVSLKPI
jgi:hypothetical protein